MSWIGSRKIVTETAHLHPGVHYLLWTIGLQKDMMEFAVDDQEKILGLVDKNTEPTAILFRVTPLFVDATKGDNPGNAFDFRINETNEKIPDIHLVSNERDFHLVHTEKFEYFELYVLPLGMKDFFEKHIAEQYPGCTII